MRQTLSNFSESIRLDAMNMNDKDRRSALELARVMGLLGGLVTLIAGVLSLLSAFDRKSIPSLEVLVNIATYAFLLVVLGLVAVFASMRLASVGWCVMMIGVGLLAYRFGADFLYEAGPILLVLAGIVGIVSKMA